MNNKIYIAGSLFKEADINQRLKEEQLIKKLLPNTKVYNPITADINDKSKLPTAKDILDGDYHEIMTSDKVLCALDDNDLGQAAEIGMIYGLNYVVDQLRELVSNNNVSVNSIQSIINSCPHKTIYAHHSDIRVKTAHKYKGNHIPYGINQFLIAAIEDYGTIHKSSTEAIKLLAKESK